MAHDHHDHDAHQGYYLEQLSTIAACGALGAVCVLMYSNDLLFLLAPQFHRWVLYGGITLLVFTAVRAVALWRSVGKGAHHVHDHTHEHQHAHDHDHDHHHHDHDDGSDGSQAKLSTSTAIAEGDNGHDHDHAHQHHHHDHAHDHAGHTHTHDHDHSWTPIKYAMLLLPIVLFFLGMPNQQWKADARELFLIAQGGTPAAAQITARQHVELFVMMFLSVFYEALPFIVLGAVIAGILEEFIPSAWIAKIVPKNRYLAIAMGALLGLLFPMCECGVIPVMRRLLLKGMPLSTCIAYMLAGPIINLVVVANTYVAFQGHTSNGKSIVWVMLAVRIGLGFGVAFVTSLFVDRLYRKHGNELLTPQARPTPADRAAPSRGRDPLFVRIGRICETTLHDFVDITVFLLLGALLAAGSRMIFTQEDIGKLSKEFPALAILGMMGFAIILCLCSEADAFVAASFTTLHPSAKLAFLVLGPMLDFKLLMMYTRVFRPRLIRTIVCALLVQVFLVSMAVHYVWEAVAPFKPGVVAVDVKDIERKADDDNTLNYTFDELYQAAYSPKSRAWLEKQMKSGSTVRVVGEFLPQTANEFTLCKTKITCCQLDMTVLRVRMILDPPATLSDKTDLTPSKCVSVKGVIQFVKVPNRDEYASILRVKSPNDISEVEGCQ